MPAELKKYTAAILAGWLLAGTISLVWNLFDDYSQRKTQAFQTARALLAQMENTKSWLANHKEGVYIPVNNGSSPDRFLSRAPGHILHSSSGQQLIRVNPGSLFHELSDIAARRNTVSFQLISLHPNGEGRILSAWEQAVLKRFIVDPRPVGKFISRNGQKVFHFMSPLVAEKQCLSCHDSSGHRRGDILGAISITLPRQLPIVNWPMVLSHLAAMTIGSLLILLFYSKLETGRQELLAANNSLQQKILERKEAERSLQAIREQLEKRVADRTESLTLANRELQRRIHERARIEEALTAIYGEFYQLFNSAPDGMLVIDRHFQIIRVNRAFSKICGRTGNEIMGHKCFNVFTGSTCHTPHCPLVRILKKEKRVEVEAEKTLSSSRTMPCIVTATPFREPDGTLIGAIMVITDITELKQTEQALEKSKRELQENNRALQDFAHSISHDLKEPLMLIQAFCARLQKKVTNCTSCTQYIHIIDGAAGRMQDLIHGLLLYSKISSKAEQFIPVNLSEILNTVLKDLALRIEETGAHIKADNLPVIEAAPLQIRQLFQNLISNSLKYHRQGVHPEITIRCKEETGNDQRKFIRLTISDNGIGFATESSERIFDFFERLQTGPHPVEGTGIGLAICRKIIQRHGGTITADSAPDQGAIFTVRLPIRQLDSEQQTT